MICGLVYCKFSLHIPCSHCRVSFIAAMKLDVKGKTLTGALLFYILQYGILRS
jgi:hypothetical protein